MNVGRNKPPQRFSFSSGEQVAVFTAAPRKRRVNRESMMLKIRFKSIWQVVLFAADYLVCRPESWLAISTRGMRVYIRKLYPAPIIRL